MGFFTASHLKKMKQSFRAKQLQKAVSYAEKIDPAEVRTAYDLSMMADIYMCAEDYESAKKVYAVMFDRNKSARTCKQLIKLCIKQGKVKEALQYVKELKRIDDEDYERFIFQYQIGQKLGQDDEYLIACLLKVREADYIDVWALELAKLYYKIGKVDECISECRNIKLWFPETEYFVKADQLLEACADGVSYEEAMQSINEPGQASHTKAAANDELADIEQNVVAQAHVDTAYEADLAASLSGVLDEGAYDDDDDDDEISMEEYMARKAMQNATPETLVQDEEVEDEVSFAEEEVEEELEEAFDEPLEDADIEDEEPYFEEEFSDSEEPIEEEAYDEPAEVEFFDEDDDDEASEEEIQAMLARKRAQKASEVSSNAPYEEEFTEEIDPLFSQEPLDIDPFFSQEAEDDDDDSDELSGEMLEKYLKNKQASQSESINRVELTTHTLINDTLTSDVLTALLEQDKLGQLGDDDAVEDSILKMIEEDE